MITRDAVNRRRTEWAQWCCACRPRAFASAWLWRDVIAQGESGAGVAVPSMRYFVVVERPFLHVPHTGGDDAVDDQLRVVEAAEVLAHQRVRGPNLFEQRTVRDD